MFITPILAISAPYIEPCTTPPTGWQSVCVLPWQQPKLYPAMASLGIFLAGAKKTNKQNKIFGHTACETFNIHYFFRELKYKNKQYPTCSGNNSTAVVTCDHLWFPASSCLQPKLSRSDIQYKSTLDILQHISYVWTKINAFLTLTWCHVKNWGGGKYTPLKCLFKVHVSYVDVMSCSNHQSQVWAVRERATETRT